MDVLSITGTSPAEAATAVIGAPLSGLGKYRAFRVDAQLVGATGGTLDVYVQRKIAPNLWADWCHFAQLASGAAAVRYSASAAVVDSTAITTVTSGGTDSTPSLSLAAGNFVAGHPGDTVRVVAVAGAGTSAGAAIAVRLTCID